MGLVDYSFGSHSEAAFSGKKIQSCSAKKGVLKNFANFTGVYIAGL